MQALSSHLSGRWQSGSGKPATLFNPTTDAPLATCDTQGLDLGAALDFARTQGGPTLRAMTFAERGDLLAAMSKAIHAQREALIELAVANGGNTRGDAKFDIDGCIGTLMAYAELGKSLGDRRFLNEGAPIDIGRGGRVQGHHLRAPRRGVAVHINAFNFPAWGLGEKAACALLAGVPVLTKPATSTALVAWRIVEVLVEAGVCPPGVLSLLCGGAGDLLDHLGPQDVLAFTGSADTGARLRGHRRVLEVGVPVNVEADSLNSAVLAPEADDATYDALIRHLHTEITQKAGQKCTATRRMFVPAERVDEVIADLSERLRGAVLGDPSRDDVHGVRWPRATSSARRSRGSPPCAPSRGRSSATRARAHLWASRRGSAASSRRSCSVRTTPPERTSSTGSRSSGPSPRSCPTTARPQAQRHSSRAARARWSPRSTATTASGSRRPCSSSRLGMVA